jgi:two-component system sensor kinase FixL
VDAISEPRTKQAVAEERVEHFRRALGPFVVAAETTRMPMIFTDAQVGRHPLVFVNDSFLALTGFQRGAVLGHGIASILGEVTDRGTLSDIETALDAGVDGTWDTQCRRVDGSTFMAAVFLTPVKDDQGVILQHFLCFVEVTGQVERLVETRNELHALYEQAPGFIATTDGPDHRFTFANASYRRLVERDVLVGLTVAEALPEVVEQNFIALLDAVYATGTPFVGTSRPIRIRGERGSEEALHYIDFVYQPVRDAGGHITGLFCEGYDVTAQRVAADKLSLLQSEVAHLSRVNAMGMMATTLAHELNQPLAAITNYASGAVHLLDPKAQHAEALSEALRAIAEASQRAGDIIRNVRELTRRGETVKSTFDFSTAVAECVRLIRAGGCPDVAIDNEVPPELRLWGDSIQIQQVLINLLRNACEAASASAARRVTVDAELKDGNIVVSVSDTGGGLSVEAARDIFSWGQSAKEGGMGLGLSISRTIIEAHQGRIWLEQTDDTGSRFCFAVPVQSPSSNGDAGV